MPGNEADKMRINASPTKEFFIYMLSRATVQLTRAIIDLVDNSVDGARRLRRDGRRRRTDHVRFTFSNGDWCCLKELFSAVLERPEPKSMLDHLSMEYGEI